MTVSSHVAEIARQGIWASLTGGWHYEPSQSLFCNTLHLYVWLVLFILPLLLGIIGGGGALSLWLMVAYTGFVTLLFTALKLIVGYLHRIFDTTEPILKSKKPQESSVDTVHSRQLSSNATEMRSGGVGDEIEMIDLSQPTVQLHHQQQQSHRPVMEQLALHRPRRSVRIDDSSAQIVAVAADVHRQPIDQKMGDDSDEGGSIGATSQSAQQLLPPERGATTSAIILPTDSMELLPIVNRPQSDWDDPRIGMRHRSRTGSGRRITRKYSESCLEDFISPNPSSHNPNRGQHRHTRRRSAEGVSVRRARSFLDTGNNSQSLLLSQRTLEQCKKTTRKSYPSKISSTDIFLHGGGGLRPAYGGDMTVGISSDSAIKFVANESREGQYERGSGPVILEESESNVTDQGAADADCRMFDMTSEAPSEGRKVSTDDESANQPTTSTFRPRINEVAFDQPGTSTDSAAMDLKGEITRFLEDLIDKHPETLDAIENVRMNRMLARGSSSSPRKAPSSTSSGGGRSSTSTAHSIVPMNENRLTRGWSQQDRRNHSPAVNALSDLASRDGTHVASNHEDTTQGAVHSFQDEDGNWWTYAFDEQSTGTAQALGSSRALREILQTNTQQQPGGTNAGSRLSALRESTVSSAESGDNEDGSGEEAGGGGGGDPEIGGGFRVRIGPGSRLRALSSSSTDSATYMPELPSSILHPASSSHASRQVSQFASVASRIRAVASRRSSSSRTQAARLQQMLERSLAASGTGEAGANVNLDLHVAASAAVSRSIQTSSLGSNTSLNRARFLADLAGLNTCVAERRTSSIKRTYYYRLKIFPKALGANGIKIKLDRLSLAALFDRNMSFLSAAFDVVLAIAVAILAIALISRNIYAGIPLVIFAIVIAAAQFSLLKSVQPDAASPIHGFNWLVAYSRPVYFCLIGSLLLMLDQAYDVHTTDISWSWNPFRWEDVTEISIVSSLRDAVSVLLLLLPITFTLGLLPQVNTLLLHILEQIEMHVMGGSACFGLISAGLQLAKSVLVLIFLTGLAIFAHSNNPDSTQTVAFSALMAACVAICYVLSRCSSNPALMYTSLSLVFGRWLPLTASGAESSDDHGTSSSANQIMDPLPAQLESTLRLRLKQDIFTSLLFTLLVFALHCTSVFTATQPYLQVTLSVLCIVIGIGQHYVFVQLRTQNPWKLVARPLLRAHEFGQYESLIAARLMLFEKIHVVIAAFEKNLLYPLLIVSSLTRWGWHQPGGPAVTALIALRLLRAGFSQPQSVYLPLLGACLLTEFDLRNLHVQHLFPTIFFLLVVIWPKCQELLLKLHFVLAYVAPWQISWGSAFHAFAQPFSVPHSAFICTQAFISSIFSAPLNPFLGSSFFLTSYVRPVKFWEKDYNTRRVDHSNTRLIAQIDRGPMTDDSNLNAVFYEHLTRSLQKSLAGDLALGRWATAIAPGDCFILASYYLNCLVHIIEVGNGFITFQLRGLEFRGTYCHQREVEAITEDITEGSGCCCCSPGSLPGLLSFNTAWSLRWLAWEVTTAKYIIEGYSITDNSAVNLLQVHELRRLLVTLYVKCIVYYAMMSPKLDEWLALDAVKAALEPIMAENRYVDLDHMFCAANDEDFDIQMMGVSKHSFTDLYHSWIQHCAHQRIAAAINHSNDVTEYNPTELNALCFALSVLGRRALGAAAHNRHANAAESFLYGLHALFKGDFRITCQRDEWVFADMDLLRCVIAPSVRMALKLHQDHFAAADDFDDSALLFARIAQHEAKLFISHEHDPAWRRAIMANTSSLLALRHMYDDGQDDYKIIMLNKMHLNMRVIKLNRECVRAFWAGQQQELIFLRNRNPERGSIQNARQVLRNMINSSADQPIGYPIYVSPLTTSFVETHQQLRTVLGAQLSFESLSGAVMRMLRSMRRHFGTSGSTNLGGPTPCGGGQLPVNIQVGGSTQAVMASTPSQRDSKDIPTDGGGSQRSSLSSERGSRGGNTGSSERSVLNITPEQSIVALDADGTARVQLCRTRSTSTPPPPALASDSIRSVHQVTIAVAPTTSKHSIGSLQAPPKPIFAEIVDQEQVFRVLNEPLKATGEPLVQWPDPEWRRKGGRSAWPAMPDNGMRGQLVHRWTPFNPDRLARSHAGTICLLYMKQLGECYVPIAEDGIRLVNVDGPDGEEIDNDEILSAGSGFIFQPSSDTQYPI